MSNLPRGIGRAWLEQFARERGDETFRRMWLLEQRGYYRETQAAFQPGYIEYRPYADYLPTITLYPDGKVVGRGNKQFPINCDAPEGERDRIYNFDDDDVRQFDRWIEQVRMPNPWDRVKKFREDVKAWGCLILILGILYLVSSVVVNFVSDLLGLHWH